jgi:6-phosphogluconolactonase
MKRNIFIISFLSVFLFFQAAEAKKHILYVGTYTKGTTNGIFVYSFNDRNGRLSNLNKPVKSSNPSFLAVSPNKKFLYAVGEVDSLDNKQSGGLSAFKTDKKGKLILLNHVLTHGPNPCHVCVSPDGKRVVASNYSSGSLSFFNVLENGALSEMTQSIQHQGSGPVPERQTGPHAHSSKFDLSGKLLYAADLGIDELKIYDVPVGDKPYIAHAQPYIKMEPGSGPRHFEFSSDGRFLYVINELNSTLTVLMKYGAEWKQIQTLKTFPKDFKGENACADIHISADGRFVYGSNRGHNSIAIFKRDTTNGKLTMVETVPVEGDWPRNFTLDPSGNFLLVANQKSNDITVFKINQESGKISYTRINVHNESPVCLQFLE